MKQDVTKYLNETFVDFEGKKHIMTLCALSQTPSDNDCKLVVGWETPDGFIDYDNDDYMPIKRVLTIGVSVCSPEDTFNEEYGRKQAYSRALNDPKCSHYFCPNEGDITYDIVDGAFKKEIRRIKENPELIIKGYNARKAKFDNIQKIKQDLLNMTPEERLVFDLCKKGVDVMKCVTLLKSAQRAKIEA